jgi:DNA-binding MarR family transcriptional regulator
VVGVTALARLLAIAYRQLVDDLHVRLRERGRHNVRPAYGFVLLAARDAPVTVSGLADGLGVTKQAASKLAESMVTDGYLQRGEEAADARRRPLILSQDGHRLLSEVEEIYSELESGWAERIGADAVERLRADLIAVVSAPDGTLPAIRPTW